MPDKLPVRHLKIGSEFEGQRLDNWLLNQLKGMPRTAVYRLLRKGEIRVNGGRKKAEYRLQAQDDVRLPPMQLPDPKSPSPVPKSLLQSLQKRILHDDDNYLVIDKPSGIAVHGGSGINYGAIEVMRQLTGLPHLELAHRIDRDTSGCLLFAKNRKALRWAHEAFREGQVRKRYITYVDGTWPSKTTRVQMPLLRFTTKSGERRVRVATEGKASRSDIQVLKAVNGYSELAVFPHTGRTHQIRIHCQASGHIVVGDEKYGSDQQQELWQHLGAKRLCLHAQRLRAQLGDLALDVQAPVPQDMQSIWLLLTA